MSIVMSILVQPNKYCAYLNTKSELELELEQEGLGLDKFIALCWKNKCKENPELFELDCTHGVDCQRINNCGCTDIETTYLNDKRRAEEQKYANKNLARNVKRRIGYKKLQAEQQQQPQQQQPDNRRSSYSNFESFAEEYFRQ